MGESRLPLGAARLIFVGGKGGVGKTTTASALAMTLAGRGERCLLVSTDPAHSLGDLFDADIGEREHLLLPNLHGLEIDPDRQVARHLESVREALRAFVAPAMYGEIERQVDLARLAPGGVEAALLERVATLMGEAPARYDRVIFDTAPTGQTLRLLALPAVMTAWTEGLLGSRRRSDALGDMLARVHPEATRPGEDARSARIRDTLQARRRLFSEARRLLLDATATAFLLVLVPEKLPVEESRKALAALREYDVPVRGLVINRVLPPGRLGEFLEQRRAQEARYLDEVAAFAGGLPAVRVPLLPHDVTGAGALQGIARHLGLDVGDGA